MAWRGWEVGMRGDQVAKIQAKLIHKYQWVRDTGLRVTGEYDQLTADIIHEFQLRTGLPANGIADWRTQDRLGVIERPQRNTKRITVYTVNGTGVDMWTGYPADIGRVLDPAVFYWQPVAYPAAPYPMGRSAKAGEQELVRLMRLRKPADPFILIGYSQGAMVTSRVYRRIVGGDLRDYRNGMLAGVTFGNPLRERGHTFPGGTDPGGHGLDPKLLMGTPDWWHDYAIPGDIYTCASGTDRQQANDNMTAIYKLVQGDGFLGLLGKNNLVEQLAELAHGPIEHGPDLFRAISSGIGFIAGDPPTAPHIEYHVREAIPGVTFLQHAIDYVRQVGDRYMKQQAA